MANVLTVQVQRDVIIAIIMQQKSYAAHALRDM